MENAFRVEEGFAVKTFSWGEMFSWVENVLNGKCFQGGRGFRGENVIEVENVFMGGNDLECHQWGPIKENS